MKVDEAAQDATKVNENEKSKTREVPNQEDLAACGANKANNVPQEIELMPLKNNNSSKLKKKAKLSDDDGEEESKAQEQKGHSNNEDEMIEEGKLQQVLMYH